MPDKQQIVGCCQFDGLCPEGARVSHEQMGSFVLPWAQLIAIFLAILQSLFPTPAPPVPPAPAVPTGPTGPAKK
jgi:hypothetical protein